MESKLAELLILYGLGIMLQGARWFNGLSILSTLRVRFRSNKEANLDHVYYPGSSSREFRFHHLVLKLLNLLIILSMLSNSSSVDLRLITEKQWKKLGFWRWTEMDSDPGWPRSVLLLRAANTY